MRRLVLLMAAIAAVGSVIPAAAASRPAFQVTLAPARVVVPVGAGPIRYSLWNRGTQDLTVTVSASVTWLTPTPAAFTVAAGDREDVIATLAPTGRGKGYIIFAADPATVETTLRVTRVIAAVLYVGVAPPMPATVPTTPTISLGGGLGVLLGLLGLLLLLGVLRRRQRR